jgi:hypothetical protein
MSAPGRGVKVGGCGGRATRGYSKFPHKVLPKLGVRNAQRRQFRELKIAVAEELRKGWRDEKRRYLANPENRARRNAHDRAYRAQRQLTAAQKTRARELQRARGRRAYARHKAAAAAEGRLDEFMQAQRKAWQDRKAKQTGSRWSRMSSEQKAKQMAQQNAYRRRKRAAAQAKRIIVTNYEYDQEKAEVAFGARPMRQILKLRSNWPRNCGIVTVPARRRRGARRRLGRPSRSGRSAPAAASPG